MQSNTIINLNSLLDLSARLYESDNEEFILNATLLSLMGKLRFLRGCIIHENPNYLPIVKGNLDVSGIVYSKFDSITILADTGDFHQFSKRKLSLAIPLETESGNWAIFLGGSYSPLKPGDEEYRYMELVCSITSNAIARASNVHSLKSAYQNIKKRNQLLTTMFELGNDFSSLFSRDLILKTLSLHLMGQLMTNRYAVFSFEQGKCTELVNKLKFSEPLPEDFLFKIENARLCDGKSELSGFGIEAAVPLVVRNTKKGILLVGNRMDGRPLDEEGLNFIQALGNTAISAIENNRLFNEELERKKLESELDFAREIQQGLLPDTYPLITGFEALGRSDSSRQVGGDYFDVLKLESGKYLLIIADVSGKGMPAALIMANFQAALRVLAAHEPEIINLVKSLNKIVCENTSSDKFITAFVAILDSEKGMIEYVNAGHNAPVYVVGGQIRENLDEGGLILGFDEELAQYESGTLEMEPGSFVLMFTDGVAEATMPDGKDFSEDEIHEFLRESKDKSPEEIIESLFTAVRNPDEEQQFDDITALVLARK
jgi:sigma-B regulation protein RsbU (phosphoserine phosphatase)